MTTERTFLVLPLVAAATATRTADAPWPDAAWREIFDRSPDGAARPISVADFWHQASDGEIAVRFRYHRAVVRDPDDPTWTALVRGADAGPLLRTIVTESVNLAQLQGMHGVIVVASRTAPSSAVCSTFTVPMPQPQGDPIDTTFSAVYQGWSDGHTVFCHELGHALGFPHPFGVVNSNGGTEYGSPPCVMGTASRWGQVTAPLTPPPGSSVPAGAGLWATAGPDLSRASYVRWALTDGLPTGAVIGGTDPVTIGDRRSGVARAVTWHDPDTDEYIVAEVRRPAPGAAVDWDAALRLDPLTDADVYDAPGVVVHSVARGWSNDVQITYLGTVPLPLGLLTDLEVTFGRRLRVRVLDEAAGVVSVSLGSKTSTSRPRPFVRLSATVASLAPPQPPALLGRRLTPPMVPYDVGLTGPTCTVSTFWGRRVDRVAEVTVRVQAVGADEYGTSDGLQVHWTVAGAPAPQPSRLGQPPVTWRTSLATSIAAPDGDGEQREDGVVELSASASWDTLTITTGPGQGRFRIPFAVSVEQDPATVSVPSPPLTAESSIEVTTAYTRFGEDYREARAACERYLDDRIRDAQRDVPSLRVGVVLKKILALPVPRLTPELARELARELQIEPELRPDLAPVRIPGLNRRRGPLTPP